MQTISTDESLQRFILGKIQSFAPCHNFEQLAHFRLGQQALYAVGMDALLLGFNLCK